MALSQDLAPPEPGLYAPTASCYAARNHMSSPLSNRLLARTSE
jgi:hypothetical protein